MDLGHAFRWVTPEGFEKTMRVTICLHAQLRGGK